MSQHPHNPDPTAGARPVSARADLSRAHARDALPPASATGQTGLEHLGALVRTLRTGRGLSVRALARRAVVARSTVQRLERGMLRPRKSLLLMIANAIDPDECKVILGQLVTAAGTEMGADTPGWERWRRRQMELGWLSGDVPLPTAIERSIRLHQQADEAWRASLALTDKHLVTGDVSVLAEAVRLLALSRELRDQAGPTVALVAAGRRVVYGLGVP